MKVHLIFVVGFTLILASPASTLAAENEDTRLTAFFKEYLDESFRLRPMENTRPFEQDARVYNEYISDSTYLLLAQSSLPKPVAIKSCVARMAFIPKVVAAAKENL